MRVCALQCLVGMNEAVQMSEGIKPRFPVPEGKALALEAIFSQ